jgi:hypothetical protein
MPKKLKKYLIKSVVLIVWLLFVTGLFQGVGASFAGEYFGRIEVGLDCLLILVIVWRTWRVYSGVYRTHDLLLDEEN